MSKKDFSILLEKYVAGTLTPYEKEELAQLLHNPGDEEDLKALIDEKFKGISFREMPSPDISAIIFQRIMNARKKEETENVFSYSSGGKKNKLWLYAAAAVTVLLALSIAFVFYNNGNPGKALVESPVDQHPVAPPTAAKVSITLANGKVITLDSLDNGTLAQQGNANVVKLADGEIAYRNQNEKGKTHEIFYNVLNVPRGSKVVSITLSDGTKVWLNAASSLKYPAVFATGTRKVEVTGEVYFEVASLYTGKQKNAAKIPFTVKVNDKTEVNVLGTHFNIHAYENEPFAITLLEGVVKVNNNNHSLMLSPGQQAQLKNNGAVALQNDADLEQVMAWKNGYFQFEGSDIKDVMGEITRWYDVDVQYEGDVISQHFRGTISRNVDAAKVFKMLEATDAVHFKVEGKNIIVTP